MVTLTPDLLEQYGLSDAGRAAEAAARQAVERLPGAVTVRVQWRGPVPDEPTPPLVAVHPLGSTAAPAGPVWHALGELATGVVRSALQALAGR